MENRRRVTEEDLLITEALIAQSYGQLKQSVVQVPSRALKSVGQTAREHPFATAATAVVAGVAVYGIIKMITSCTSVQKPEGRSRVTMQKDTSGLDLMKGMLPMIIPLVSPYIMGYIRKYLGNIQSGERD